MTRDDEHPPLTAAVANYNFVIKYWRRQTSNTPDCRAANVFLRTVGLQPNVTPQGFLKDRDDPQDVDIVVQVQNRNPLDTDYQPLALAGPLLQP